MRASACTLWYNSGRSWSNTAVPCSELRSILRQPRLAMCPGRDRPSLRSATCTPGWLWLRAIPILLLTDRFDKAGFDFLACSVSVPFGHLKCAAVVRTEWRFGVWTSVMIKPHTPSVRNYPTFCVWSKSNFSNFDQTYW
jgi:hypothetical protein